jgi:hypothetical protein
MSYEINLHLHTFSGNVFFPPLLVLEKCRLASRYCYFRAFFDTNNPLYYELLVSKLP